MKFTITRNLQGRAMPGMPITITVSEAEGRTDYNCPAKCEMVWPVLPESIPELIKRGLVLESQRKTKVFVCTCLGNPANDTPFAEALEDHLETWGKNCGSSLAVYRGHLEKLLEAHVRHMAELVPKPKAGTLRLERSLICLDTETTGTDSQTDRVIELGIVRLDPDGKRHLWQQRFNPGFPIPTEATAIHGIADADVADMPTFESMAEKIYRGLQGRDIAGYSLRLLDLPILDTELRRVGLKLDLTGIRVIDAAGIFFNKKPRDLSAAVEEFCGRSHNGAHGAAADATASLDVLFGQLGRYDDLAAMTLDELAAFSRRGEYEFADIAGKLYIDSDGDLRYTMQKVRDVKVKDDIGFAFWMKRANPGFPGSTIDALDAELRRHGHL